MRIWCPLRMWRSHEELLSSGRVELSDSQLVHRNGRFFLHLTVKRRVKPMRPSGVPAVDLGERFLAASVALSEEANITSPKLHGKEARGVRRHYVAPKAAWRKEIAESDRSGRREGAGE